MKRIPILLVTASAAGLLASCWDRDLTAPSQPEGIPDVPLLALSGGTTSTPVGGCARFTIEPKSGWLSIRVAEHPSCGPAVPTVAGNPMYNMETGEATIPIRIDNRGTRMLRPSLRLHAWHDSTSITAPDSLAGVHDAVVFLEPDSVIADTARHRAASRMWKYDEQIQYTTFPERLKPGEGTQRRLIKVKLKPGITSFDLILHADAQEIPPVPAVAPDTVPRWAYGPDNAEWNSAKIPGVYMKDLLLVLFRKGVAQADRQAAIDLVGGEVIGGERVLRYDGLYFVALPSDSTGARLLHARDALEALPQVEAASVNYAFAAEPTYLAPNDGAYGNYGKGWKISPDSADGSNWALEAINAPMAWGCTTGSGSPPIAVVDFGFHKTGHPDTDSMRVLTPAGTWDAVHDSLDHGTKVLSVLGARGDNAKGLTGMMWDPAIVAYDNSLANAKGTVYIRYSPEGLLVEAKYGSLALAAISSATLSGARVVNMSFKMPYRGKELIPENAIGNNHIGDNLRIMIPVIRRLETEFGLDPLLVIGAGNDATDAKWAGYTRLRTDFPHRVLVVAGMQPDGAIGAGWALWPSSNYGSLVDIAAPSAGITGITGKGIEVGDLYGTSYAAPLVTGAAGLLLSFDPSLTTPQLRDRILEGAARAKAQKRFVTDRQGNEIPMLDAYEPLKEAAKKPGARLCGNRVWSEGGSLKIQRGSMIETLLLDIAEGAAEINIPHGGDRISYWDTADWEYRFLYNREGRWVQDFRPEYEFYDAGASLLSSYGISHDGQTRVRSRLAAANELEIYTVDRSTWAKTVLKRITLPNNFAAERVCVREERYTTRYRDTTRFVGDFSPWKEWSEWQCAWEGRQGTNTFWGASLPTYAPLGDEVLVPFGRTETSIEQGSFYDCGTAYMNFYLKDGTPMKAVQSRCRDHTWSDNHDVGSLYSLSLRDSSWTRVDVPMSTAIRDAVVAEDGTTLLVKAITDNSSGSFSWEMVKKDSVKLEDGSWKIIMGWGGKGTRSGAPTCEAAYWDRKLDQTLHRFDCNFNGDLPGAFSSAAPVAEPTHADEARPSPDQNRERREEWIRRQEERREKVFEVMGRRHRHERDRS